MKEKKKYSSHCCGNVMLHIHPTPHDISSCAASCNWKEIKVFL